jgi:aryl-alcohol dehydrogenase-like predicted oxidoreductase
MPRFAPDALAANVKLLPAYTAIAREAGCTPSQLALAWLLQKAEHIIPIPGTTSVAHLKDDLGAASITLSPEVVTQVEALINQRTVTGDRYSDQANSEVDTERF